MGMRALRRDGTRLAPVVAMRDVLAMERARLHIKGNVRRRSDWFIARYAQTTPMTNVATSDQPILDLRRHNSNSAQGPPTKLLVLCV